jgi:urease accessory protein
VAVLRADGKPVNTDMRSRGEVSSPSTSETFCDEPKAGPPSRLARFEARSAVAYSGSPARLRELRQESPLRFLRPRAESEDATLVVVANTAGGVVGGDRLTLALTASDGAELLTTGQAAEKIYRARDEEEARLRFSFESRSGARLEVLPQGTLLFDGARLRRKTVLRADVDAILLYGEILHFGRTAMQESFDSGHLHDRTEIWRGERLELTDALRIDGDLAVRRRSPAGLADARASAVAYLVHPSPERFLPALRERLRAGGGDEVRTGAACHDDGLLVVRWLARDGAALRRSFGSIWAHLRSCVLARPERMPRIWSI